MSVIVHRIQKIDQLYLFMAYLTVAHPIASDDEMINV